ncbi:acetyl-CoA-benzylalcohol acetyltransferase-like [Rhodamnia argentea]|uniref:Acetyl-CoA-benzylalcohol acetyltransferase-like n=1 Tax=Rhodamnia argentea TaxID=178133 RepID=A0A8B8PU61_9MYRT|nr:acetyl-CoA-benzylalcohol acetyltransferase-like [Rhodamnia argentea]XP_048135705.1 acetyl-CoA-benzylalcohol acetyltransferase-like [Rhodamnia argentea]
MKVEVQWKKLVKPSVPTPNNRQKWKLSSMDELQPLVYVGVIFYYRDYAEKPGVDIAQRLHQMEESLSKTLTIFYPMAGRYKEIDDCFVHCNDLGVEFVHAKVDGQIDQGLHGDPDMDSLNCLSRFPTKVVGNPLVVIQVNTFECGGLAIGVRFAHKIGDMYTMAMFINSWATTCRGNIDAIVCPNFELSSLFPVKESGVPFRPPPLIGKEDFVSSRFRFSGNAISKLKALARDNAKDSMAIDFHLSRVEVVSALISRALVDVDRNINGEQRAFVVCMTVNLRQKINLAIPSNTCGNLFAFMFARSGQPTAGKSKLEFKGMVNVIRHLISDAKTKYATVGDGEELCSIVRNSLTEFSRTLSTTEDCLIGISSWCWFGLYENDFGWGRPVLVTSTPTNFRFIFLIDGEESGGIDAWITIDKDEMILLKQDPEFLAFTS